MKSAKGVMFESNLLGTHPKFFENAKKHFTIVHEINLNLTIEQEDAVWDRVVDGFDGRPYDFAGALYLGVSRFLMRIFGMKPPKYNKFANPNMFFCEEVYDALRGVGGLPITDSADGLETPHDLYKILTGEQ
jgi:hypothetical protein